MLSNENVKKNTEPEDLENNCLFPEILEKGSIGSRFQPIISMREKKVIGLEALSFGINPLTGRRIPPDVLFSLAAREMKSLELDRLCREKCLGDFSACFKGQDDYLLWLNFETAILDQIQVGTGRLLQAVQRAGLRPCDVVIEIIESKVSNLAALTEFVNLQRGHGFNIALDDVGAGHSNLERIALIKPDVLKIDRFLIRDLDVEYHKQEVVRSLCNLAQGIGALVVAEGIETEAEALAALDLGITLHQGYFYAHPDDPFTRQRERLNSRMEKLAESFRFRRIDRFSLRKNFFLRMADSVHQVAARLRTSSPEQFEEALHLAMISDQSIECLYILNNHGLQVSETVCNQGKLLRPHSSLFRPAPKGADLSLKDYFLLIKAGLERYVSDPYISQASGNLCVTVSQAITAADGFKYVLCVDCDFEAEVKKDRPGRPKD
ncbi:MAG: EAL domain-containing protein [Pseudomonadota bacterium]